MAPIKVSKDNLIKVFDFIRCGNGVSQKEITAFMEWSPQSTIAAVTQLIKDGDITEIVTKQPGVTKDDVEIKGYIVE